MSENQKVDLEEVMESFIKDQSKENKAKIVNALYRQQLILPAIFPEGTDVEALKPSNPNERVQIPKEAQPIPCVLKNQQGETFLPIYTDKNLIPAEQKPQVYMQLPFMALVTMAMQEKLNLAGLALNPYKQNILLRKPLLEALKEQEKKRGKVVRVSPAQAKILVRRKIETELMPRAFYANKKEFAENLSDQQESFVKSCYEKVYKNPSDCPYQESDFSVMPLNIREDLLLVRVDCPEVKVQAPVALRIYALYNEKEDIADYYTIEPTREQGQRKIGHVNADLKYEDLGEAPVEGAELQKVLDLYDAQYEKAN